MERVKSKKRPLLIIFVYLIFKSTITFAQVNQEYIDYFNINDSDEIIECVRLTTKENIAKQNHTILYFMGSLPNPIVVTEGDGQFVLPLGNFDYKSLLSRYNIVIFAQPYTPAKADVKQLNEQYQYVPDVKHPELLDNRYLENNFLEKHLARGNCVLNYLRKQPWVKNDHIMLVGHSQGAHLAAHLAYENDDIYAVWYLSGNPTGRYSEFILSQRVAGQLGKFRLSRPKRTSIIFI